MKICVKNTIKPKGKNYYVEKNLIAGYKIDQLQKYLGKWLNDKNSFNINSVSNLGIDENVDLPLLNKEEVYKNYTMAQMVTVGLPIVILAIFGFLFTFLRKRKYSR